MSDSNPSGVSINVDAEITRLEDDRLGRAEYASRIAERIADAGSGPSVVFGLAGPWGSGKSSVINMIVEHLRSTRPDQWSIATLTAWSAADTDTLTEEFYRAIASAMPQNDTGKKAKRMLAAAAPVVSAVGRAAVQSLTEKYLGKGAWKEVGDAATDTLADQLGEFRVDDDPFIARFTAISDAITVAGKDVLVVVDDVDRLHTEELLSLMKAVRLLGRFNRVHYLLAYDEQTVLDVLTGSDLARGNRPRARQYLEKIVQYPFVLPPLQPFYLEAELRSQLTEVASHHDQTLAQPTSYRGDAVDEILDVIPHIDALTLRSVNRLCHQLDTMLTLVGGTEVDLIDATLLIYLRLHYPDLHAQLPRWRRDLLGDSPALGSRRPALSVELWHRRIASTCDLEDEDEAVTQLHRLLGALFPLVPRPSGAVWGSRPGARLIRDSEYFDRYFTYTMPIGDIRDADVRAELAELVTTGQWHPDSVIRADLNNDRRRGLIRRKILQSLTVIEQAASEQSAAAAHAFTHALRTDEHDLVFSRWAAVIYALLGHAICTADTPTAAIHIVANYRIEFGLAVTVDVLSMPTELHTIDHDKVIEASTNIRRQVLELCLRDLTEVIDESHRTTDTLLSLTHYLDDDLWAQLAIRVQTLLTQNDTTQLDLAARFVSAGSTSDGRESLRFEWDAFEKLIPRQNWSLDNLPTHDPATIDHDDLSLDNRKRYAAIVIRQTLETEGHDA